MSNTFESVRNFIGDFVTIEPEKITGDTNLATDLELDSISLVNMAAALENEYGIAITEHDFSKLTTVSAIVDYLNSKDTE